MPEGSIDDSDDSGLPEDLDETEIKHGDREDDEAD